MVKPHLTLCAGIDKKLFFKEEGIKKKYDFLVVGSFVPVKGLDVLKEALEELNSKDTSICFVGNGPLEPLVHEMSELADVTIIGNLNQEELRRVYNESKFLLFTSKNDAFGLVVTESIYSGTPAIVNLEGGAQAQVIHGINGFIYEEHDPRELAHLMKSVLGINPQRYEMLVDRCVSSNYQFSLVHVAKSLIQAYEDIHFNYRTNVEPVYSLKS